jgi:Fe2+ or Zn2+ uptake regulation protein
MERHHHLIDDETGRIYDVEWNDVEVKKIDTMTHFEVRDYSVVMHGRRRRY